MIKNLFLICVLFFPLLMHGQEHYYLKFPGLQHNADTAEINRLVKKGTELKLSNPDSARLYLDKAMRLSSVTLYTEGILNCLVQMADLNIYKGNYKEALNLFEKALYISHDNANKTASIYTSISRVLYLDGNYEKSAGYIYQVIQTANKYPTHNIKLANSYANLSVIWFQLQDSTKSNYYLKLAEAAAIKEKDYKSLADIYNKMGNRFLNGPNKHIAFSYYSRAMEYAKQCKDPGLEMLVAQNIGGYYRIIKENELADKYFDQALRLAENPSISPYSKSSMFTALGYNYYLMKDYPKAEYYVLKSLEQSKLSKTRVYSAMPYKILSDIYAATNRYGDAVKMQNIYMPLQDSLMNNDKIKAVNLLEVKYNAAQKDNEIARKQLLLEQEKNRVIRRNVLIASLLLCTFVLIGLGAQFYRSAKYRRRLQKENMQLLERDEQIQLLKATVRGEEKERARIGRELHDGTGSMLSVIKMGLSVLRNQHEELASDDDFYELMRMVDQTTSDVRETAHNLMPDPLLKGGMDEAISIFCETLRKKHDLEITLQYYGEMPRLSGEAERSIFRILKEMVQYRIAHSATIVFLQLNWQQDILSVILEDNGKPKNDKEQDDAEWQSILSRIKMMNAFVEIESNPGTGTITDIEFNLISLSENSSEYA